MKRHPALHPLSDDHHRSLVLARRLQRIAPDAGAKAVAALGREVRSGFEVDVEPHFAIEERWLLPLLEERGRGALVERTRKEHAQIRAFVAGRWSAASARALGALLARHVRFEERVLFPEVEALFSERELERVRSERLAVGRDEPAQNSRSNPK